LKPFSIKDIAKKANASITTVSFVINGKAKEKGISDALIKTVEQVVKDYGYKPNEIAQSLRTGQSKIIGLIVEDISNPFFSSIARFIEDMAYLKGYKIIYSSTDNNLDKAKELITTYKLRKVDAYIIAPPPSGIENTIQSLIDERKPVVLFDRNLPSLNLNFVGVNHFDGTYEATKALVGQGKSNIAFVTVDLDVKQIDDRLEGYRQALTGLNIPYNNNLILKVPFNQDQALTILQIKNLFTNQQINGVLFATNYLAISGLKALKEIKGPINKEISVIAYDDHEAFELHTPCVSTIKQPLKEIAQAAIQSILDQLSAKDAVPNQQIIFSTQLIIRS
jgi:LacI family transcriptional regulator